MDTSATALVQPFPVADALAHGVPLHRDGRILFANQAFPAHRLRPGRAGRWTSDAVPRPDGQVCGQGQARGRACPGTRHPPVARRLTIEARCWVELTPAAPRASRGADTTLVQPHRHHRAPARREALSQVHAELKAQFELSTTELQQARPGSKTDLARREAAELELLKRYAELTELNCLLHDTQQQLVQSEKLASIGQLAAGVAHEINNPIGCVRSNIGSLQDYVTRLFEVLDAYQAEEAAARGRPRQHQQGQTGGRLRLPPRRHPGPHPRSAEGTEQVRKIVQDLRDFSAAYTGQQWQAADLHQGPRHPQHRQQRGSSTGPTWCAE